MITITENELFRFKKMEENDTKWQSLSTKNMSAKFEKAARVFVKQPFSSVANESGALILRLDIEVNWKDKRFCGAHLSTNIYDQQVTVLFFAFAKPKLPIPLAANAHFSLLQCKCNVLAALCVEYVPYV